MAETFTYDNLVAGAFPIVTKEVTVLSGQNLVKGTAIGIVTASGKAKINDSAQSDGTEVYYAVTLEAIDASAADKVGVVALSGEFNREKLVFGGTDTMRRTRLQPERSARSSRRW